MMTTPLAPSTRKWLMIFMGFWFLLPRTYVCYLRKRKLVSAWWPIFTYRKSRSLPHPIASLPSIDAHRYSTVALKFNLAIT